MLNRVSVYGLNQNVSLLPVYRTVVSKQVFSRMPVWRVLHVDTTVFKWSNEKARTSAKVEECVLIYM